MQNSVKSRARRALEITITFTPWVSAMYVFYWLDSSGIWTSETAHRGKLSVAILVAGMGLSFLVHSHFIRRHRHPK
jgi:hypothetical protein